MANRFSIEAVFNGIDRITAPVSRMENNIRKFSRNTERAMRRVDRSLSKTVSGFNTLAKRTFVGVTAALTAVAFGVTSLTKEFSKLEDATAAFTPLLGSAAKAKKLVNELTEAAAKTPLQFETLAGAANKLLGFGAATEKDVLPMLLMLGDLAGGDAKKLDSVALAFGKIKAQGIVTMQEINQLIDAGVPIVGELEKVTGKAGLALKKFVSGGKLGAEVMEKAFKNMTAEGGKFFRAMDIKSRTTTGLFSTLKGEISLTAAGLGEALNPFVKQFIGVATDAAKMVKGWVDKNKLLIRQRIEKTIKVVTDNIRILGDVTKGLIGIWVELIIVTTALKVAIAAYNVVLGVVTVSTKIYNAVAITSGFVIKTLKRGYQLLAIGLIRFDKATKLAVITQKLMTAQFILGVIASRAVTLATKLQGGAVAAWTVITSRALIVQKLWAAGAFIAAVATKAWTLATVLFNAAVTATPFGLIIKGIALFAAAAALVIANWEPISEFFIGLWDSVKNAFSSFTDSIKPAIDLALAPIRTLLGAMQKLAKLSGISISLPKILTPAPPVAPVQSPVAPFMAGNNVAANDPALDVPMISPQQRVARSIEESRTTVDSTLTVRAEPGTSAELQSGGNAPGAPVIKLAESGNF